ncbi:NAD-dependent epimerase/dehydratase family protein [Donghicola sp. XS_ASV15]|uniref:NAD-dependent epimerase/dehydratase family protein n=1 Tax=Donghicola sp. XS_ASV15 TaxID=3241295 RepID=UPI003511451F
MSASDPVIVTGANGQVGRRILRAWSRKPPSFSVAAVARSTGPDWQEWLVGAAPIVPRARAIVGLWGVCFGTLEETRANLTLAQEAQQLGAQTGADRVIHLSTQSVYGRNCNQATERQTPTPVNSYGQAKAEMESYLRSAEGPRPIILRVANVIGADAISRALAGTSKVTLDRFADGKGPLRSFVGIADLADLIACAITCPLDTCPDVINVAAQTPLHMEEILKAANRPFEWRDAPENALRVATVSTDMLLQTALPTPKAATAAALYQDWKDHAD